MFFVKIECLQFSHDSQVVSRRLQLLLSLLGAGHIQLPLSLLHARDGANLDLASLSPNLCFDMVSLYRVTMLIQIFTYYIMLCVSSNLIAISIEE